jgi:hypothetical protein
MKVKKRKASMKNKKFSIISSRGILMLCMLLLFNGCMMAPAALSLKNPEKIFQAPLDEVYLAAKLSLENYGLKFTEDSQTNRERVLNAQLIDGNELTLQFQLLGENLTKVAASTGYFEDDETLIQKLFLNMDQKIQGFKSGD